MADKTIEDLLRSHRFFEGMKDAELATVAGCGQKVVFGRGQTIARVDDPADWFLALHKGRVAIEVYVPGKGARHVLT
ncbi:MAG TPA: Crp/Fnr family transcriptional regulator, partial [Nannocystis exedens]|nr:Crp/Fnr family transcriptional regulator [Nannocystis exedens]